jgi:hypothetical protein
MRLDFRCANAPLIANFGQKKCRTVDEVHRSRLVTSHSQRSGKTVSLVRGGSELPALRRPGTAASATRSSAVPKAAAAGSREMTEALSPFVSGLNDYPHGPARRDASLHRGETDGLDRSVRNLHAIAKGGVASTAPSYNNDAPIAIIFLRARPGSARAEAGLAAATQPRTSTSDRVLTRSRLLLNNRTSLAADGFDLVFWLNIISPFCCRFVSDSSTLKRWLSVTPGWGRQGLFAWCG